MTIAPRHSDLDHINWLKRGELIEWQGLRILDLGCGSGYLCQWLMDQKAERVVGIDMVQPPDWRADEDQWQFGSLDLEKDHWNDAAHQLLKGDADVILAFDIIEHLTSPWNFLENCHRLLASNGKLVLTTPNTNSWERLLKPETWSGAQDPQHKIMFNRYSLGFALNKSGFQIGRLEAPLRSAKALSGLIPNIGGQLFSVSGK